MDDSFVLLLKNVNIDVLLYEWHPSWKFTAEKRKNYLSTKLWHICTSFKLFRCFCLFTPKFNTKFDNHLFKCSNKNKPVAKKPNFKVYAFMTVNNENKLLCYESYLHKMGFDTMNC